MATSRMQALYERFLEAKPAEVRHFFFTREPDMDVYSCHFNCGGGWRTFATSPLSPDPRKEWDQGSKWAGPSHYIAGLWAARDMLQGMLPEDVERELARMFGAEAGFSDPRAEHEYLKAWFRSLHGNPAEDALERHAAGLRRWLEEAKELTAESCEVKGAIVRQVASCRCGNPRDHLPGGIHCWKK